MEKKFNYEELRTHLKALRPVEDVLIEFDGRMSFDSDPTEMCYVISHENYTIYGFIEKGEPAYNLFFYNVSEKWFRNLTKEELIKEFTAIAPLCISKQLKEASNATKS